MHNCIVASDLPVYILSNTCSPCLHQWSSADLDAVVHEVIKVMLTFTAASLVLTPPPLPLSYNVALGASTVMPEIPHYKND